MNDTQPNVKQPTAVQSAAAARQLLVARGLVMDYTADIIRAQAGHGTAAVTSPATGMPPFAANLHTLALDHVDFSLAPGETVAVMGPSGSGKSTLLHALAGIIRPTAGDVTFRGTDLTAMSDADRTKLRRGAFGFVFQSGQLLPELPAVENIALPLMLGGADYRAAVDQAMLWLERLGLRALASHRPGEMSGGQMQRVAIARALAVRPAVVFADEPTGALDQATGREVMGILMDAAHANGAAVVVVTHDPNVAAFCSRTVMMRDGRLGVGDDRDAGRGVDDGDGVDTVDPVTAGSVSGTAATPAVDPFTANPADPGRGWIGGAR